jgi:hypothetical protein
MPKATGQAPPQLAAKHQAELTSKARKLTRSFAQAERDSCTFMTSHQPNRMFHVREAQLSRSSIREPTSMLKDMLQISWTASRSIVNLSK